MKSLRVYKPMYRGILFIRDLVTMKNARRYNKKRRSFIPYTPTPVHLHALRYTFAIESEPNDGHSGIISPSIDKTTKGTALSNLYDDYRIKWVAIKFTPRQNVTLGEYNRNGNPHVLGTWDIAYSGKLYTIIDKNDSDIIDNLEAFIEYTHCKSVGAYKPHFVSFRPHVMLTGSEDGANGAFVSSSNCWVRTSNASVKWLGCKWLLSKSSLRIIYDVELTMYTEFKNPK